MEVWKSVGKQNLYGIGIKISVKLNSKKIHSLNLLLFFVLYKKNHKAKMKCEIIKIYVWLKMCLKHMWNIHFFLKEVVLRSQQKNNDVLDNIHNKFKLVSF